MKTVKIESNAGWFYDLMLNGYINVVLFFKDPQDQDEAVDIISEELKRFMKFFNPKPNPMGIKIPDSICECGYVVNRSADVQGDVTPKKDDLSICINCGQVRQFQEDLTLKTLNDEELKKFQDSDLWHTILKAQLAIKQRKDDKQP